MVAVPIQGANHQRAWRKRAYLNRQANHELVLVRVASIRTGMPLFATGERMRAILTGFRTGMLLHVAVSMLMCLGLGPVTACSRGRSLRLTRAAAGFGSGIILDSGFGPRRNGIRICGRLCLPSAAARLCFALGTTFLLHLGRFLGFGWHGRGFSSGGLGIQGASEGHTSNQRQERFHGNAFHFGT